MERIGLLATLNDDELEALIACAETVTVHADAHILDQGQHNDALFIVREGLFHAHRQGTGKRVLLARLDPGSGFGEVSLFDPGPTTATVQAVSESSVLKIHNAGLTRLAATCPSAAHKLLQQLLVQMAQRLRNVDERLVDSIAWGRGSGR